MLQRQEDGKKHLIGYYSTTLNEAQRNYDIYELELLAIAECLNHWRPYLAGSPHEIIVHTDVTEQRVNTYYMVRTNGSK